VFTFTTLFPDNITRYTGDKEQNYAAVQARYFTWKCGNATLGPVLQF